MRAHHVLCLALASTSLGCGGATYASGVFHDGPVSFRVDGLDAPWERVAVGEHNDLAWSNAPLAAIAQVNATCDQPDQDVPLQALTRHLLNGFTAYTYPPVDEADLQTVPMDGREAFLTPLVAKLDGVLRARGCEVDAIVASFHGGALDAFRDACPSTATSASWGEACAFWLLQRLRLDALYRPAFAALQVPERFGPFTVVDRGFVERARKQLWDLALGA